MSKRFTKIICMATAVISALGIASAAGCSNYFDSASLGGNYAGEAVSNGGFAVGKGDYIYFLNGVEGNTADNSYGKPVKGAIYRISNTNLKSRNYNAAEKVVPVVAYSSNYDTGIFAYGDYIYYGTPSTAKNSEGEVQNSVLDMKRSKLDGTETMRNAYISFPSLNYDYRFVEENGVVYLMYVAEDETLFEESSGVTNLHSLNTQTGVDTLLVYNVSNVTFDAQNKSNSRVYYTMNVRDYTTSQNYGYNQLYTVTASATENKFADLSSETVNGWDDENDRYINCGELVLDGIGSVGNEITAFNKEKNLVNELNYTYSPAKYVNGTLFYTRTTPTNSGAYLFSLQDNTVTNSITGNANPDDRILSDGSSAKNYEYIFNGKELTAVINAEGTGISINKFVGGKLQPSDKLDDSDDYFKIVKDGTATLLSVDTENKWLYYSVSGGNGYSIHRVDYSGNRGEYTPMPAGETDKTPVKILDLDADSSWYKPEFINGYLLFASETANMTAYNYVMCFDLHADNSDKLMTNGEIRTLNELYNGIEKLIDDTYGDKDKYPTKDYANVQKALKYAKYSGDYDYLKELAVAVNAKIEEDDDLVYSEQTLKEYEKFLTPTADNIWADYNKTRTVNGETVYANVQKYYYGVLGEMTEADVKAYMDGLKSAYLEDYPEDDTTWYEGLSTGEKVGFIVGVCVGGLAVIAGVTVLIVYLVKKGKKQSDEPKRRRMKVDTTDDKDIDVYAD
ncbi:MAG: hypothetical protein K2K80_02780 [Clostridia bacterium]|nr:hypothetical protein [Clostridia bacterium]